MQSNSISAHRPTAIVIGGSAAGLLTAAMLRRGGWRADVYEKSNVELIGRGAGIACHPELAEALDESGAGSAGLGITVTDRVAYDQHGSIVARRDHPQIVTSWDRIHQLGRQITPDDCHHLGHELVAVTQTEDQVTATFGNGRTVTGDVLVGADGFRSTVRDIYRPDVKPEYAGYVIWRGVIEEGDLPPDLHRQIFHLFAFFFPPGYEAIGYPIPGPDNDIRDGHRRYNWVWYTGATPDQLADILTDRFGRRHEFGIPPTLLRPEIVAAMRQAASKVVTPPLLAALSHVARPFVTPIYDCCSSEFVFGRVALIGDAAVTARPHIGYGTTKAAGDAVACARALNAALAGGDVPGGLRAYEAARLPVGRRTYLRSRQLGDWMGVPRLRLEPDEAEDKEVHTLAGILRHTASNEFLTGRETGRAIKAGFQQYEAAP